MRGIARAGASSARLSVFWVSLGVGLAACAAPLPPAATPDDLAGCAPGSFGALGPDACARDADCMICHEASECGLPIARTRGALTDPACAIPPSETLICDASGVACCQHRCVLLLGPPAFGRGTEDTSDLPRQ